MQALQRGASRTVLPLTPIAGRSIPLTAIAQYRYRAASTSASETRPEQSEDEPMTSDTMRLKAIKLYKEVSLSDAVATISTDE
jgi:hypothetical protein